MASAAAIALPAIGVGGGIFAAKKKGVQTPGSTLLGVQPDIPGVGELPSIPTDLDQAAIDAAREGELERINKRKGRASTITKKPKGILGAETTGQLLGG